MRRVRLSSRPAGDSETLKATVVLSDEALRQAGVEIEALKRRLRDAEHELASLRSLTRAKAAVSPLLTESRTMHYGPAVTLTLEYSNGSGTAPYKLCSELSPSVMGSGVYEVIEDAIGHAASDMATHLIRTQATMNHNTRTLEWRPSTAPRPEMPRSAWPVFPSPPPPPPPRAITAASAWAILSKVAKLTE